MCEFTLETVIQGETRQVPSYAQFVSEEIERASYLRDVPCLLGEIREYIGRIHQSFVVLPSSWSGRSHSERGEEEGWRIVKEGEFT